MTDIYERLPALAASARNFVSQLDAPTLHDRLNKMASACDEAYEEISRLRAQVAALDNDNTDLCLLIARHNVECESECLARDLLRQCHLYTTRGLKCPDCAVKNWAIDANSIAAIDAQIAGAKP